MESTGFNPAACYPEFKYGRGGHIEEQRTTETVDSHGLRTISKTIVHKPLEKMSNEEIIGEAVHVLANMQAHSSSRGQDGRVVAVLAALRERGIMPKPENYEAFEFIRHRVTVVTKHDCHQEIKQGFIEIFGQVPKKRELLRQFDAIGRESSEHFRELESQLAAKNDEIDSLHQRIGTLEGELTAQAASMEEQIKQGDDARGLETGRLQEHIQELEGQIAAKNHELAGLKEEIAHLARDVAEKEHAIADMKAAKSKPTSETKVSAPIRYKDFFADLLRRGSAGQLNLETASGDEDAMIARLRAIAREFGASQQFDSALQNFKKG